MPKAILEFTLPEEQQEHENAVRGTEYAAALRDLDQLLRSWSKHGFPPEIKDLEDLAREIRNHIAETQP